MKRSKLLEKYGIYLLSFVLTTGMMLLIFVINEIYPFGERSFLNIDMYHQYFPFLTEFYHKLKEGDSLLYSFHAGIGSNFVDLYGYYLATPFNWLCILIPEPYLMEFMSYLVIIKLGLCSVTFAYYIRRHFDTKNYRIVFFALAYAMSGYVAAYNWDVMWLDCIILAPLILLGLERLVKKGDCKLYTITLALSILTNYYLSIPICIFLVLYFVVLLVSAPNRGRAFVRFALFSILAAGIACVVLLPAFAMLRQSEYAQSNFPSDLKFYFPLTDVFARHMPNVLIETGLDNWPNIYCGAAVLFLFPLYLMCRKVPARERVAKAGLLLFMTISFSSNVLTFIWHGMNYPSSLPARQSFLYILLLLAVCYEAMEHLRDFHPSTLCKTGAGVLVFLLFSQKVVTDDAFAPETWLFAGTVLLIYAFLIWLLLTERLAPRKVYIAALFMVTLELGLNMLFTSVSTVSRTNYLSHYDAYREMAEDYREKNPDFFRIVKENGLTQNDSMLHGYNAVSMFSSTTNSFVNTFYEKYGMRSSRVFYSSEGITPLTSALLSARYTMAPNRMQENSLSTFLEQRGMVSIYENTYCLPLGFMVRDSVPSQTPAPANDPLQLQNQLAARLGSQSDLFLKVPVTEVPNESVITVEQNGNYYAFVNESKVKEVKSDAGGVVTEFEKLKNPYILDLGYQTAGTQIKVTAVEPDADRALRLTAYRMDEAVLSALVTDLEKEAFVVESHSSAKFTGSITAQEYGNLFFSIPYDSNWSIEIDGVPQEAQLYEDTFLSVPVSAGEHTVTLTYHCRSLVLGFVVSLVSVLIFSAVCIVTKQRNKKKSKLPSEPA